MHGADLGQDQQWVRVGVSKFKINPPHLVLDRYVPILLYYSTRYVRAPVFSPQTSANYVDVVRLLESDVDLFFTLGSQRKLHVKIGRDERSPTSLDQLRGTQRPACARDHR